VFTEFACYVAIIAVVYLRKKRDWDRLLRLPLKLPKTSQLHNMENMLGALIEETEANKFKDNLIEESEICSKGLLTGFEDKFEFTEESIKDVSVRTLRIKERYPTSNCTVKKTMDFQGVLKKSMD